MGKSEAELKKLKVSELKDELTSLDLSTSGVKAELIERLLAHYAEADALGDSTAAVADDADEDVLLGDGDAKEDAPAKAAASAMATPAVAAAAPAAATPAADADAEKAKAIARAARFGMPVKDESTPAAPAAVDTAAQQAAAAAFAAAKAKRAARFGIPVVETPVAAAASKPKNNNAKQVPPAPKVLAAVAKPAPKPAMTEEQIALLKKRAERFGAVVAPALKNAVKKEEKLKRTAEVAALTEEQLAKKKARADRFKGAAAAAAADTATAIDTE